MRSVSHSLILGLTLYTSADSPMKNFGEDLNFGPQASPNRYGESRCCEAYSS